MPVDTRVASGDTAILKCIPPRGNPKPRIHWLKNGQPLSSSEPRWHVTEVGSLVIEAVQKSDEANYVCRAENMVGARDSETAGLDVHGEFLYNDSSSRIIFCLSVGAGESGQVPVPQKMKFPFKVWVNLMG